MPTTTIPALPAVTDTFDADVLYISQAGVSSSITHANLFNFHTGAGNGFKINNIGLVGFSTGGQARMDGLPGMGAAMVGDVGSNVTITAAGGLQLYAGMGQTWTAQVLGTGATIVISNAGHITLTDGSGASVALTYVTTHTTYWDTMTGNPATYQDAIERIASAVVALRAGSPIP